MSASVTAFSLPNRPSSPEIIPEKGKSSTTTTKACTWLRHLKCTGIEQGQTMRLSKDHLVRDLDKNLFVFPTGKAWCPGHGGFVPIFELEADHLQPKSTQGTDVDIFNQKIQVTVNAVEDIANQWLVCRSCNGKKSRKDPLQYFKDNPDYGDKFLQTIRTPARSVGIRTSLLEDKISKECTLTYEGRSWKILSIDDSVERKKVVAKCDQAIEMGIRLWKDKNEITISPEIDVLDLTIHFEYKTQGTKIVENRQSLSQYIHNPEHLNIRLKHPEDSQFWDATIDKGQILGRTSSGLPFRISMDGKNKHAMSLPIIQRPDDVLTVNIPAMYCRNQHGVLCDPEGKKLGKIAARYSKLTHAHKIEQKKEVDLHISFPLDQQISQTHLEAYQKGKEDLEARKKLRALSRKIATVRKAVAENDAFLSDSDHDLSPVQKKGAFEAALSKFPETFKKLYKDEKQKLKISIKESET